MNLPDFGLGVCAGAGTVGVLQLVWDRISSRIAKTRLRCAWCGKVRVSLKGQACPDCIASVLNGPRAAPNDWPEA